MSQPKAQSADIALLLEGTFPYVSGGVSSWINQIVRAYPEYRYAIVFLGSRREDYGPFKYPLPDNVVHFEEHYLHEPGQWHPQPAARICRRTLAISARCCATAELHLPERPPLPESCASI